MKTFVKSPRFALADLFCGAGGTSTGAVEALTALGYAPALTAINHWRVAVATHERNHPDARHLCAAVDNLNPRELFRRGELRLLWASPECTHHSVARGGMPVNEQSRATAWCVTKWAEALLPDTILVENVPEFRTWGPIGANGRPLPSRKGETFEAWLAVLRSLGYRVEWKIFCAADYGDPTTRKRLFVQCQRGRRKLVWPEPTHAEAADGQHRRWVSAREIIDWSIPGRSVFERQRPLSENTMRKIFWGLGKFGLDGFIVPKESGERRARSLGRPLQTVKTEDRGIGLAQPYIITMEHGGGVRSARRPLPTITCSKGGSMGVAKPYLVKLRGTSNAADVGSPLHTVTSGGHFALAQPYLVHTAHGGHRRPLTLSRPVPTVAGNRGEVALCEPFLLPHEGRFGGNRARSLNEPVPTVTASHGGGALIEPFLIEFYGTGKPLTLNRPLGALTCKAKLGLARPLMVIKGKTYLLDILFRMLRPHELALAQGFRRDYRFAGTLTDQVKQIGNAVPRRLARALVAAAVGQNADVSFLLEKKYED